MHGSDNSKEVRSKCNDMLYGLIKLFKDSKLKELTDKVVQQDKVIFYEALKTVAKSVYLATYFHPK